MFTRSRLKKGEGKLKVYNLEIGSRRSTRKGEMAAPKKKYIFNFEDNLFEASTLMKEMVGEIHNERGQKRGEGTSQVENEDDH
jgi:hypothetical protein